MERKVDLESLLLIFLSLSGGKIEGKTRIHKLVFLGKNEHGIPVDVNFVQEHYGPFSVEIEYALKNLNRQCLIEGRMEERKSLAGEEYKIAIYELSDLGKKHVTNLTSNTSPNIMCNIRLLLEEFGKLPLQNILRYVYSNYSPE